MRDRDLSKSLYNQARCSLGLALPTALQHMMETQRSFNKLPGVATPTALQRMMETQRSFNKLPGVATPTALQRMMETQRSFNKLPGVAAPTALQRMMETQRSFNKLPGVAAPTALQRMMETQRSFNKLPGVAAPTALQRMMETQRSFNKLPGVATPTALQRMMETQRSFNKLPGVAAPTALQRMMETQRSFNKLPGVAAPTAFQRMMEIQRSFNKLPGVAALLRAQHWADELTDMSPHHYASLLGTGDKYRKQFAAVNFAAHSIAAATTGFKARREFTTTAGLDPRLFKTDVTTTKMSLFAGLIDTLGPAAGSSQAAYNALLGCYSTPDMSSRPYWRDLRERRRYYRDQNVDEGLINSNNVATVQAMIASGVVVDERSRDGAMTAVVDTGSVTMRILASHPKISAFSAIEAFERDLRTFISTKLEGVAGKNWFKQRVSGDIMTRAKDRRREAMYANEPYLPLIQYTDLGDLLSIILRKDNWGEVFETIFRRSEWLKVDIERINTHRRPTMHSRPIDPVQLCEIVLTIRRLVGWIECASAEDQDWDHDI